MKLSSRVDKLEATALPGSIVPLWVYGRSDVDVSADVAEMKRASRLTDRDQLLLVSWKVSA